MAHIVGEYLQTWWGHGIKADSKQLLILHWNKRNEAHSQRSYKDNWGRRQGEAFKFSFSMDS